MLKLSLLIVYIVILFIAITIINNNHVIKADCVFPDTRSCATIGQECNDTIGCMESTSFCSTYVNNTNVGICIEKINTNQQCKYDPFLDPQIQCEYGSQCQQFSPLVSFCIQQRYLQDSQSCTQDYQCYYARSSCVNGKCSSITTCGDSGTHCSGEIANTYCDYRSLTCEQPTLNHTCTLDPDDGCHPPYYCINGTCQQRYSGMINTSCSTDNECDISSGLYCKSYVCSKYEPSSTNCNSGFGVSGCYFWEYCDCETNTCKYKPTQLTSGCKEATLARDQCYLSNNCQIGNDGLFSCGYKYCSQQLCNYTQQCLVLDCQTTYPHYPFCEPGFIEPSQYAPPYYISSTTTYEPGLTTAATTSGSSNDVPSGDGMKDTRLEAWLIVLIVGGAIGVGLMIMALVMRIRKIEKSKKHLKKHNNLSANNNNHYHNHHGQVPLESYYPPPSYPPNYVGGDPNNYPVSLTKLNVDQ